MKKKVLCLILALAMVLPLLNLNVRAADQKFYTVYIDAGQGPVQEKAIVSDGELYIPAESFGKYTYFQYNSETRTFLMDGQEERKAFKRVIINPETKKVAALNHIFDLEDCFIVDGVAYLPFCQMMPILNGQILYAEGDTIYVANPQVTLADILYDFNLNDYFFNLYDEFYGDFKNGLEEKGFLKKLMGDAYEARMLIAYVMPSYLFNTVADFRLDRLDVITDSGTFEDYRDIFSDYLREEDLFLKANEMHDDPRLLLSLVNNATKETKFLNNTIKWIEMLEEVNSEETEDLLLAISKELVDKLEELNYMPDLNYGAGGVITAWHDNSKGISFADFFELFEYAYVYFTHVEDNHKMLDAVYNINSGGNYKDVQFRAAMTVYDLYGEEVAVALADRMAKELAKEVWKETAIGGKLKIYELTAKISGEAWEVVIPGDTKDVSVLTLHAGVADSARMSAAAYNLDTEAAVEDYRLSLLLMMLASRKAYKTMAEVAEGYGQNAREYNAKVEKLENKIMGLYLAAENLQYEAFENFAPLAEKNRNLLKETNFFASLQPLDPGEELPAVTSGEEKTAFLAFLEENPVYQYYALLDINQDGCLELIAKEAMNPGSHGVDLYVYRGGEVCLGYEDIWGTADHLYYNPHRRWLESSTGVSGDGGVWFYSLDKAGNVVEQSFAEFAYGGKWYNGNPARDTESLNAWQELKNKYDPSTSVMVEFLPTGTEREETVPNVTEPEEEMIHAGPLHYYFLAMHPEYNYYALLDINQDGIDELLTCETTDTVEGQYVDIWVNQGGIFTLSYEDIWIKIGPLTYNPYECWVENKLSGTGGGGVEFFYLDGYGNVIRESYEHYEWCGGLYNGEVVDDWEEYMAYERLEDAYDPEKSEEIIFLPRPF